MVAMGRLAKLKMADNIHAVVQDTDNQNMIFFYKIDDQMPSMVKDADRRGKFIPFWAKLRIFCDELKALLKFFQIFFCLRHTPFIDAIKPYVFKVSKCLGE